MDEITNIEIRIDYLKTAIEALEEYTKLMDDSQTLRIFSY